MQARESGIGKSGKSGNDKKSTKLVLDKQIQY